MSSDLLEIQPRELNFIFELKKQSSCSIRLVNKSKNHVAFKVKTTSPKKYCVRPNIGIIKPKSTCDFTVTMQAQKVAPPDMVCKDKFLVQGTIVPAGSTEEDIHPGLFAKEDGRFVEENKLKVILVSPPNSPVLSPINGTLKQVPDYEASILKDQMMRKLGSFTQRHMDTKDVEFNLKTDDEVKPEKGAEYTTMKQIEEPATGANYKTVKEVEEPAMDTEFKTMKGVEEPAKDVEYAVAKDTKEPTKSVEYATSKDTEVPAKDVEHTITKDIEKPAKDGDYKKVKDLNESAKDVEYKTSKDIEEPAKVVDQKTMKDIEEPAKGIEYKMKNVEELKLVKDIDEMKSKLNVLESKLSEAEVTISKLTAERRWTVQERESLQQELALLRRKGGGRKVQVGFPLLFVCMVALVSVVLGYLIHC